MSQRTKAVLFPAMVLGICSGAALGAGAVPAGAQRRLHVPHLDGSGRPR